MEAIIQKEQEFSEMYKQTTIQIKTLMRRFCRGKYISATERLEITKTIIKLEQRLNDIGKEQCVVNTLKDVELLKSNQRQ